MNLTELTGNAERRLGIYSNTFNKSLWPLRSLRDKKSFVWLRLCRAVIPAVNE